jgi:hypothetical protein
LSRAIDSREFEAGVGVCVANVKRVEESRRILFPSTNKDATITTALHHNNNNNNHYQEVTVLMSECPWCR